MNDADAALYKFLEDAFMCPVSGLPWPPPAGGAPGGWVQRSGPLDPEGLGFVTFRGSDLAPWCCANLFRVEIEGPLQTESDVVIAERVRLVEPEQRWPRIKRELYDLALARVRALAPIDPRLAEYAGDVAACVEHGMINGTLFVTAIAHAAAADLEHTDHEARRAAFLHERALQSRFIADRLRE